MSARPALLAALGLCVAVTVPLVVTPTITLRGGFDFNRVEDGAHGVAAALTVIALVLVQRRPRRRSARAAAALATIAAIGVAEVVQTAAPGRSPSLFDAALGLSGMVVGLGALVLAQRRIDATWLRWVAAGSLVALGGSGMVLVS